MLDRVLACLLLVLLSPLFAVIAIAILVDDGTPVIFRQKRIGVGNGTFTIYKFRTMVRHADELLDQRGQVVDNRITRIGRFLRFTSLDELPQLVNIVSGSMSFIGPRPTLEEHFARYTDEQKLRFAMRPGVTGLAQVSGRNTIRWSRRIALDLAYIEHYSLCLDIKVLLRTVKVWLLREGIVADRNTEDVDDLARDRTGHRSSGSQAKRCEEKDQ